MSYFYNHLRERCPRARTRAQMQRACSSPRARRILLSPSTLRWISRAAGYNLRTDEVATRTTRTTASRCTPNQGSNQAARKSCGLIRCAAFQQTPKGVALPYRDPVAGTGELIRPATVPSSIDWSKMYYGCVSLAHFPNTPMSRRLDCCEKTRMS